MTTRATHALRPWKLRVNLSALSQISPDGAQNLTKSERGGGATLYKSKNSQGKRGKSIDGPCLCRRKLITEKCRTCSTRAAEDGQTKAREWCEPPDRRTSIHPFNLQQPAVRYPSHCSHVHIRDDSLSVALFPSCADCATRGKKIDRMMDSTRIRGSFAYVIKVLNALLGSISREHPAKNLTPIAALKRSNSNGDFRAVEIAPGITCCAAAMQATGRSYLVRKAPPLPLYGCTMAIHCSCMFRMNADRRNGDRRLSGAAKIVRWFGGPDRRKRAGRRKSDLAR